MSHIGLIAPAPDDPEWYYLQLARGLLRLDHVNEGVEALRRAVVPLADDRSGLPLGRLAPDETAHRRHEVRQELLEVACFLPGHLGEVIELFEAMSPPMDGQVPVAGTSGEADGATEADAFLLDGLRRLREHDYGTAAVSLGRSQSNGPTDWPVLALIGEAHRLAGEPAKAAELLQTAWAVWEQEHVNETGRRLRSMTSRALASADRAAEAMWYQPPIPPRSLEWAGVAATSRATASLGLHHYADALDGANRALARNQDDGEALSVRVRALIGLLRFDDAVAAVDQALPSGAPDRELRLLKVKALVLGGQQVSSDILRREFSSSEELAAAVARIIGDARNVLDTIFAAWALGAVDRRDEALSLIGKLRQYPDPAIPGPRPDKLPDESGKATVRVVMAALHATMLEEAGRPLDAAMALADAGRIRWERNEWGAAEALFGSAIALAPGEPVPLWYLADTVRGKVESNPDEAQLSEALDLWERGYALSRPAENIAAWVYLVRAQILAAMGDLDPAKPDLRWRAVLACERALAHRPDALALWRIASKIQLGLLNYEVALNGANRSVGSEHDLDIEASLNRLLTLVALDDPDASDALDSAVALIPAFGPAATLLRAIVLTRRGEYHGAIEAIDRLPDSDSPDPDVQLLRSDLLLSSGHFDEAAEELVRIRTALDGEQAAGTHRRDLLRAGVDARAGRFETALPVFQTALAWRTTKRSSLFQDIGFCLAGVGRFEEAGQALQLCRDELQYRVEAVDALGDCDRFLARFPDGGPTVKRPIAEHQSKLAAAVPLLPDPIGTPAAVERELAAIRGESQLGVWAWTASTAGLARLALEAESWEEATSLYRELRERSIAGPDEIRWAAEAGLLAISTHHAVLALDALAGGDIARAAVLLGSAAEIRHEIRPITSMWDLIANVPSPPGVTTDLVHQGFGLAFGTEPAWDLGRDQIPRLVGGLVPTTWVSKESITLLAPDRQANVIASSEPLDGSIDVDRYATIQGDLLHTEFPGYEELAFEEARIFGGRPGYMRHFRWTPPDGIAVRQMQLYWVEDGRGFTATATTPEAQAERYLLQLQLILEGLVLRRAKSYRLSSSYRLSATDDNLDDSARFVRDR